MTRMAYAEIELDEQDLSITPLNKMKNNLLGYNSRTFPSIRFNSERWKKKSL